MYNIYINVTKLILTCTLGHVEWNVMLKILSVNMKIWEIHTRSSNMERVYDLLFSIFLIPSIGLK